ncbi:glycerophosphodiester phosphodiesterase family protein [Staphylococcus carnosus]|uniref:glycerophosphodiester phosphodiesterase family protein n=1 Tax=Staphylococcus carnosus TaxID=1281 RepID=UPI000DFD988B|nr:glycerophosphodiester phosphodiesterase family protein [Staphylococcus carnosus]QPT03967.1 glycerophosphoryl diester phosphodiesterase [Staphylococcus carnosus]UQA66692.1 glycerophosphoryl diester phosphodiesterase [Staphylococcus carnosus]UTB78475.1 glycerophosphoryl diester phosphodiesterase [Staphylococcus carnosus]UTB85680.1 glycerophosphoryl diester phosphodiesterase [Staphylococcus carnosus]UTB88024.1 glycerophosphoryl diester phosphodiesterase [Staphylococcus carnosus]
MKKIYGHRGVPSLAPENTIASYETAAKIPGLKWIEIDVAITEDEQLIIIHDDYLDRTTSISGEISDTSYEIIKNASAGYWFDKKFSEEKVLTFSEFIDVANELKLNVNIELKGTTGKNGPKLFKSYVHQLTKLMDRFDSNIEILFSSFNIPLLKTIQEVMPEYPRAVLYEKCAFYEDWRTVLDFCDTKILHLEEIGLTENLVKIIKSEGYTLNVYTVNEKDRANQLFRWGVDGIFTDVAQHLVHLQN